MQIKAEKAGFKNLLELNIGIIFMSTSGALGRYIDLPVPTIIASRALLAGLLLYLFCKWRKFDFKIINKDRIAIFGSGLLMGVHWITYFYSLKLSNVAVGMIIIFTYPAITSMLEPLILKTKFEKIHLVLATLVLIGIYFLVPEFSVESRYTKALGFGLFSSVCYSFRNIIMKSKSGNYNGSVLMLYQLVIIEICLFPSFFIADNTGFVDQIPANLLLAILTTTIGHTLFLYSFKHFSVTSASIISALQPVYGIIIGMLFLKEYPETNAIIGGSLILLTVVVESFRTYKA